MNAVEALGYRMAFSGLPAGEVQRIVRRTECGTTWLRACLHSARGLRQLAESSEAEGRLGAARDAWLWTAAAYQAASFCVHFEPSAASVRQVGRARRLARAAYARAIAVDGSVGRSVEIPCGERIVRGYLRRPPVRGDVPVVVLLNGLDSICEVEMRLGTWLQSRGCAVLALDLPADAVAGTSSDARRRARRDRGVRRKSDAVWRCLRRVWSQLRRCPLHACSAPAACSDRRCRVAAGVDRPARRAGAHPHDARRRSTRWMTRSKR
jgi:hypothetical protein